MGQKTKRAFSKIPIDQCNEQLIDWLKNESAVIGNLDDPATIRRVQVARHELARMVQEFESLSGGKEETTKHHEQFPAYQTQFQVCTVNETYLVFLRVVITFINELNIPGKLIDIMNLKFRMI